MPPSIIFDDFDRFLHHGVSKATPGTTKINAFWCMFAGRSTTCVSDHCNTGIRILCGGFNGKFLMILSDFCIHGVSKATPGTTKANAFWCNFAGRSTARVFDQCNTGLRIFCGHFVVNFRRFWAIFASMAWAKQHRERQKWTPFYAFSHVGRRRAFVTIAKPEAIFFRGHFKSDLHAFWVIFARFFGPVRALLPSLRMVLGALPNA